MPARNLPGLPELLDRTLIVAGLQGIEPDACELLALIISEETGSFISGAALRSLYELMPCVNLPSLYVLDTLSRFCGFKGWGDWCRWLLQGEGRSLARLFHLSAEPMWVFHAESLRFLEVNAAAVRQYGYSRSRFLEMSILDIRPAEDAAEVRRELAVAGDFCVHRPVFRHRLADGELVRVEIITYAVQLPEGDARLALPVWQPTCD